MELLKEAIANDPMWALILCILAGMLITGAVLSIAACMRSSQISRDEEERYYSWDARRKS